VDSGFIDNIALHGGQPGAPSSLPGLATGTALLRQAATLDLAWAINDQGHLKLRVGVTNSGAGHYLPTGADDLRQLWLALRLTDEMGEIVWEAGQPGLIGRLPPDTVQFHKVLGDANDRPIDLHRFWVATQVLEDTRLAPMERRQFEFASLLDDISPGPYKLQVRLLYRDVSPAFAEFALGRPVTDLPIFEVAAEEILVSISAVEDSPKTQP
jgi:hypothetical protein